MKTPKIVHMAKLLGIDPSTLHRMKADRKKMFQMLWKGYLQTLIEEEYKETTSPKI